MNISFYSYRASQSRWTDEATYEAYRIFSKKIFFETYGCRGHMFSLALSLKITLILFALMTGQEPKPFYNTNRYLNFLFRNYHIGYNSRIGRDNTFKRSTIFSSDIPKCFPLNNSMLKPSC